jgi:hypothetical protein
MAATKPMNVLILSIIVAIILFNAGLTINFFAANGRGLAALFNNENILLFAGVELVVVLLAYIVHRQISAPKR